MADAEESFSQPTEMLTSRKTDGWLRDGAVDVPSGMEKKSREERASRAPGASPTAEELREIEAKKKLARPRKDKTEVTIGPTDRSGPDVVIE